MTRIIESVEQIIETTDVYQVVLENPVGNLYANNLLVHVGAKIPALFKRESINCDPGTPYFRTYPYQCSYFTSDSFPGFLKALTIIILGIVILGNLIVKFLIYIPNFLRFHNRKFQMILN